MSQQEKRALNDDRMGRVLDDLASVRGLGSFVVGYDRGFSDLLTRLNSRGAGREFRTEQAFGKGIFRVGKSNQIRVYGLSNDYRFSQTGDFDIASRNTLAALSWTSTLSKRFDLKATASATRYEMDFNRPAAPLRVGNRDDVLQARADAIWDFDRHLYLTDAADGPRDAGQGFARGAELFLKKKSAQFDFLIVYNFLASKRAENDIASLAPSPYEIPHSTTAIFSWKLKNGTLGLRYSSAAGRPTTPLEGRIQDEETGLYSPVWAAPMSGRTPAYRRLDLKSSWTVHVFKRMVILYFGVTNLLNAENISDYAYADDFSGRTGQASIFGRSLFLGLYVPFF